MRYQALTPAGGRWENIRKIAWYELPSKPLLNFLGADQDIAHKVKMLKRRGIDCHLGNPADRGEEAASLIAESVVKFT